MANIGLGLLPPNHNQSYSLCLCWGLCNRRSLYLHIKYICRSLSQSSFDKQYKLDNLLNIIGRTALHISNIFYHKWDHIHGYTWCIVKNSLNNEGRKKDILNICHHLRLPDPVYIIDIDVEHSHILSNRVLNIAHIYYRYSCSKGYPCMKYKIRMIENTNCILEPHMEHNHNHQNHVQVHIASKMIQKIKTDNLVKDLNYFCKLRGFKEWSL